LRTVLKVGQLGHDAELPYIVAMFHDTGLQPPYSTTTERSEVDRAHAARDY
jgi:hypothetical protein